MEFSPPILTDTHIFQDALVPPTSCTSSRPEDMGNGTFAMFDSRAYKEFADVDLRSSVFGRLKKRATNKVTLDM